MRKLVLILGIIVMGCLLQANTRTTELERKLESANEREKIHLLNQLAREYYTIAPGKSIMLAEKALKSARRLKDDKMEIVSLKNIGVGYYNLSHYVIALDHYIRAHRLALQQDDKKNIGYLLNNIGLVYWRLGKHDKAVKSYRQSISILMEIDDTGTIKASLNNLGIIYSYSKKYTEALEHYKQALELNKKSGDKADIALITGNIGRVYGEMGEYSLARHQFNKAYRLYKADGQIMGMSEQLRLMGEIHHFQKNYPKARQLVTQSLELAKKGNFRILIKLGYLVLADIENDMGNYTVALKMFKEGTRYANEMLEEKSSMRTAQLQVLFETEKKEREIDSLKQKEALKDLQMEKEQKQKKLLAGLLLLTLLLAVAIFLAYRLKIKANKEITSRKQQVDLLNKQLEESNTAKDRFFSIIGHDLKNPLGALTGLAELLLVEFDDLKDEEMKDFLKDIHHSSEAVHDLLENLLLWARSQTEGLEFRPSVIDIEDISRHCLAFLRVDVKEKRLQVEVNVEGKATAYADENMVRTVIRNLLSNAVKFSFPEGRITITAQEENDWLTVTIRDTGTGIPAARLDTLFRVDVHQSTPGTANETGTGLGLILCNEFIRMNSGTIDVQSEEGNGSSFSFRLAREKKEIDKST
ncbi:MAG: sensor histidine kinase [bacterium]|nr:sensor histidine kinase [bacterium]